MDTKRRRSVETEAETRVLLPHVKECLEPPGPRRDKEGISAGAFERCLPCRHLDVGLRAFKTVRE